MSTIAEIPKYKAYKSSGVDWLGDIPSNWNMLRIKTTITGSVNGVWGKEPKGSQDTIVLRVADFDRTRLTVLDDKLTYRSIPQSDLQNKLLKEGDLLLEKSGGGNKTLVGCVVLFNKHYKAVTSNFVAKMTARNGYNSRFLNYVFASLYSNNINFVSIKQTTGIQNLDSNAYFNEKMPFPMIEEQEKIVAFLDKKTTQIDEAIAIKEKQIVLLKERKQIIIQKAVTQGLNPNVPMKDSGVDWVGGIPEHWELSKLKFYIDILSGFAFKSEGYSADSLDMRLLRGVNVAPDQTKWDEVVYWPNSKLKLFDDYQLRLNDLVIAMDRPWISTGIRVTEIGEKDLPCLLLQRVGRIRGKEGLLTRYTKLLMSTNLFLFYFEPMLTGISVPHISPEQIQNFLCPIPNEEEQESILQYIKIESEKIKKAMALQFDQIKKLKEYKTTLINSAVTGKIKIQGHGYDA